jgi:hypothetical protein
MTKLQYSALRNDGVQIRLLTIFPRGQNVGNVQNEGGLVNCALNVVSLDDRPKYTSLSYVWGRADNPKQVVVNGTVVEITTNLEEALRYLQQEFEPVVLWADALCI